MTDQEQKPIVPPVADKKREIARGVAEATLEAIPGAGSFFTKILQVVVPPKVERDSEAWQEAISERTNQNTGRLNEHERVHDAVGHSGAARSGFGESLPGWAWS
jgi:hypothetical protein